MLKCDKGHRKSSILPLNMTSHIFLSSGISPVNFCFNKNILKIILKLTLPRGGSKKTMVELHFSSSASFLLNFPWTKCDYLGCRLQSPQDSFTVCNFSFLSPWHINQTNPLRDFRVGFPGQPAAGREGTRLVCLWLKHLTLRLVTR